MTIVRSAAALCIALLGFAALPAHAEEAYFSMMNLQGASKLFGAVAQSSQENNERIQREVVTTGRALDALGDSLAATKQHTGAVPPDLSARHGELSATFELQWQQINGFVDQLVMDTDAAFLAALDRHVKALEEAEGVVLGTCEPPQGVLGMAMGQSSCEGKDYTAQLIVAMDGDEELQTAVAEIRGRSWPEIRPEHAPAAPVALDSGVDLSGDPTWFSPYGVLRTGDAAEPVLLALEEGYRMSERELMQATEIYRTNRRLYAEESGALSAEERTAREAELQTELDKLKAASETLTVWREETSAAAMALIWEQAQGKLGALEKELGATGVGVCLQPGDLGGCAGVDRTSDVASYLAGQKKIVKALEKYAETIEGPELGL
jgi:hypothetical protein